MNPRHWTGLIATILTLMAGLLILPDRFAAPQLQENRYLAAAPAPLGSVADLDRFRRETDAWVADRFPARAWLIAGVNGLRLHLGASGSERVIVGRDQWLFYDDGSHLGAARGIAPLSAEDQRAWLTHLAGRAEAVPYLVVVPPTKEILYPEFGPGWYAGPSPDRPSARLMAMGDAIAPGRVLSLTPAVSAIKAKGYAAFSRHDTHWTGDGAYGGYVALMTRLQAMGFTEGPRPLTDFRVSRSAFKPQDLALMLGVSSFVTIRYRDYVDPPARARLKVRHLTADRDWTGDQVVETGQVGKPVLLLTRDSFSNALLPFLYGHFSRIILTHIDHGSWRGDLIDAYHPDIVVLEVQEASLVHVMGEGPDASDAARTRIADLVAGMPELKPLPTGHLTPARPAPGCNIEAARLGPDGLAVSGWISALTDAPEPQAGWAVLSSGGESWGGPITIAGDRPDVAAYSGKPAARLSGFSVRLGARDLAPGTYSLSILRKAAGGWIACQGSTPLIR